MRLFLLTLTLVAASMAFGFGGVDSGERPYYDTDFNGRLDNFELQYMLDDAYDAGRRDTPC